jgi:uncharacterized membrane protein YcaP (DUF421 family)
VWCFQLADHPLPPVTVALPVDTIPACIIFDLKKRIIPVMDKASIKITDLKRILLGNAPVEFMAEVLIRTVVIYVFMVLVMRLLGKRMSGQLTILDLAITIMLGAIVAPPMETPERGILLGIMILFLVLGCYRLLTGWGVKKAGVEKMMHGTLTVFVKDGVLQVNELHNTRISHAQLFSILRQKKIFNLGKVDRMYLEACGLFSVFTTQDSRPGLSLMIRSENKLHELQSKDKDIDDLYACINCGTVEKNGQDSACRNCGSRQWDKAVL